MKIYKNIWFFSMMIILWSWTFAQTDTPRGKTSSGTSRVNTTSNGKTVGKMNRSGERAMSLPDLKVAENQTCNELIVARKMYPSIEANKLKTYQKVTFGSPDYTPVVTASLIYVAEGINHCTVEGIAEFNRFLYALRKKNPKARIAAGVEGFFQIDTRAPLFKSAGKPLNESEYQINTNYSSILTAADKNRIDLFALENPEFYEKENTGNYIYTIGKEKVRIDMQTLPFRVTPDNLHWYISGTEWGVVVRSKFWANRILTALHKYDIVVVFAGASHIVYNSHYDLPILVGAPYSLVKLQTFGENKEENSYKEMNSFIFRMGWACKGVETDDFQRSQVSRQYGVSSSSQVQNWGKGQIVSIFTDVPTANKVGLWKQGKGPIPGALIEVLIP